MKKSFIEALNEQISRAEKKYREAQDEAIKNLKSENIFSDVHNHVEFGAAYTAHIDKITRYATEIKTLHEIKHMYEYFENKENIKETKEQRNYFINLPDNY